MTATKNTPAPKPTKPASRARRAKPRTPAGSKTKPVRANTRPTADKPPKTPPPSALQSAVIVLADAPREGMSAKEMVRVMRAKGLWTSPAGKTPEATVYAGILREIGRKGERGRFRKVGPGRFVLADSES